MSNPVRVLTVVLDRDYKSEDLESVLGAIRMVKGVSGVETTDMGADYMAREIAKDEVRREVRDKLGDILLPRWLRGAGR